MYIDDARLPMINFFGHTIVYDHTITYITIKPLIYINKQEYDMTAALLTDNNKCINKLFNVYICD